MARSSALRILDPVPSGSSRVGRLAAKYKGISEEIKLLEARKKDLAEKFLAAMKAEATPDAEGKLRLDTDAYKLLVVKGRSASRIDAALLVKNGVSVKVIKKSTVEGTEYEYVRIDEKKDASADTEIGDARGRA